MRQKKKEQSIVGMSFLDVISCGFGAALLLIILLKKDVSNVITTDSDISTERIAEIVETKHEASQELRSLKAQLQSLESKEIRLSNRVVLLEEELKARTLELKSAMTETQARKKVVAPPPPIGSMDSRYVGGVPVAENHLVLIVDTSGSMQAYWPLVFNQMRSILEAHPQVKGLQIMNGHGRLLIDGYANRWIPDTKVARRRALEKLKNWRAFSVSNPEKGLEIALRGYVRNTNGVSIYVLGDDFTGPSYQAVINIVERWNVDQKTGRRLAKIHGVGFPWGIGDRFSTLMREIAYRNGGVFFATNVDALR